MFFQGATRLMLLLSVGATILAGCANPGRDYAGKHPDLSVAHRQILQTGKIPSGDAVAGMTREQVTLAMGGGAQSFDKINGEDVWVYVRKKTLVGNLAAESAVGPSTSFNKTPSLSESGGSAPGTEVNISTSIFFTGDRATHAENHEEKP